MADSSDADQAIEQRVRKYRIIGYAAIGLFILWLVITVLSSIGTGLNDGTVTDPFTEEAVAPTPNEP